VVEGRNDQECYANTQKAKREELHGAPSGIDLCKQFLKNRLESKAEQYLRSQDKETGLV
jgi:hypothetical protein